MKPGKLQSPYINKLFVRLMIFTSLITMAAVFLSSLLPYKYLSNELRADTVLYNNQRLANVQSVTDNTVLVPILTALSDLVLYGQLHTAASDTRQVNLSNLATVHNTLKQKAAQYALDDLSIYYEKSRLILSAAHGIKFLDDAAVELPYDFQWIQGLDRLPSGRRAALWLEPRDLPALLGKQTKRFSYVSAVRQAQGRDSLYICLSMRDTALIQAMRHAQFDSRAEYAILSAQGTVIASTSGQDDFGDLLAHFPQYADQVGERKTPLNAVMGDAVVSLLRSEYSDWYYVMILPESIYNAHNRQFSQTVLLVCICIFSVILIVSLFFTLHVSYPFGKLTARIQKAGYPLEEANGPFGNIEDVFADLLEEADMHKHLIASNMEIVRRSFFGYLLQGQTLTNTTLVSCMDFLQLKEDASDYRVCSLCMKGDEERHDLLYERIRTKLDIYTGLKCGEGLWALLLKGNADEAGVEKCFQTMLDEVAGCEHLYAAIGGSTGNILDIKNAYMQSLSALRYAAYFPEKRLYVYRETSVWEANRDFDEQLEKRFAAALHGHRLEEALDCLRQIAESILEKPVAYPVYAAVAERLIDAVESLAENHQIDMGELYNKTLSEQLSEFYYLRDVFDFIGGAVQSVLAYIDNMPANVSAHHAIKAVEYIEENYHTDISIQGIADWLGISRYHLCRVFKQNKNITLMEYIADLRMNKAEKLLEESDLMIRDIASISGFNNITYFNKKFKQHFGVTPSQKRRK